MSKPKSKNHSFETMTTPFHKLGPKVLSLITSHLDYASASSFLRTSKVLSIYTRDHRKKGQKPFDHGPSMHDLLQIERWDCYDPIRPTHLGVGDDSKKGQHRAPRTECFACRFCLRIRPSKCFQREMMSGSLSKRPAPNEKNRARRRFCIHCGVRRGIYRPGSTLRYGGRGAQGRQEGGRGVVCARCKQFKNAKSLRLSTDLMESIMLQMHCEECLPGDGYKAE